MKEETSYTCSNDNLVILFHNVVVVAVVVRRLKGWRLKFQLVGLRGVKPECPEISCFQGQVVLQFNWFKKKTNFVLTMFLAILHSMFVCLFSFKTNFCIIYLKTIQLLLLWLLLLLLLGLFLYPYYFQILSFCLFFIKIVFCLFLQQYYIL